MEEKSVYVKQLAYYDNLTDEQKRTIESVAIIREYKKGSLIHQCCNECLGQIMIIEGVSRTFMMSDEGREITLFRLEAGDSCVLAASCIINQITFETHMIAETDCQILIVNAPTFARLAEQNIYVKCYLYETLSERFSSVMWTMQQILFMGFDRRLATFLVAEANHRETREIKMTQEQIALNLSSAREVVTRMLNRFVTEGLVELKRGMIKIIDMESLELLAKG